MLLRDNKGASARPLELRELIYIYNGAGCFHLAPLTFTSYLLPLTSLPPGAFPAVDVCFEDAGIDVDWDDVVVGKSGGNETALTG